MGIITYAKKKYKGYIKDLKREEEIRQIQKEAEYKARLKNIDKLADEKARVKREQLIKAYKQKFTKKPSSSVNVFGLNNKSKSKKNYNFITGKYE